MDNNQNVANIRKEINDLMNDDQLYTFQISFSFYHESWYFYTVGIRYPIVKNNDTEFIIVYLTFYTNFIVKTQFCIKILPLNQYTKFDTSTGVYDDSGYVVPNVMSQINNEETLIQLCEKIRKMIQNYYPFYIPMNPPMKSVLNSSLHSTLQEFNALPKELTNNITLIPWSQLIGVQDMGKQGNFGAVSKATWNNVDVCVKLLKEIPTGKALERFIREVTIQCSIKNEHLVHAYGISVSPEGKYALIMDYASQGTLENYYASRLGVELPIDDRKKLMVQVVEGLQFLHSNHIIHRDLKPDNILIHNNNAYISDFGLARTVNINLHMTGFCEKFHGAPEIIEGKPYDYKCDIYSLAFVLYYIWTGSSMLDHASVPKDMIPSFKRDNYLLFDIDDSLPLSLSNVLHGCLNYNSRQRPELKEILDAIYLISNNDNQYRISKNLIIEQDVHHNLSKNPNDPIYIRMKMKETLNAKQEDSSNNNSFYKMGVNYEDQLRNEQNTSFYLNHQQNPQSKMRNINHNISEPSFSSTTEQIMSNDKINNKDSKEIWNYQQSTVQCNPKSVLQPPTIFYNHNDHDDERTKLLQENHISPTDNVYNASELEKSSSKNQTKNRNKGETLNKNCCNTF
ncbi:hypothetical protein WA158_002366 [Blastocystis sp. Blastoise]